MKRLKAVTPLALIVTATFVIWLLAPTAYQSRKVAEETNAEKIISSEWKLVSHNVGKPFNQIQFIDESHGWGMTSHILWKTIDGGQTWMEVRRAPTVKLLKNHEPEAFFWKMQFLSLTEGWLLEGDHLLHTLDEGVSWKKQDFKNVLVRSFRFLDKDHGWVVGGRLLSTTRKDQVETWRAVIYATTDGGSSWRKLPTNVTYDYDWRLLDVWPVSPNNIWVVGDTVLHCNDSGKNCSEVHIPQEVYGVPSRVQFTNSTLGWITTNQGNKFLVTNDGGKTWDVRSAPTENGGFTDLVYANSTDAWGVMFGGIYQSKDGGKSWTKVAEGTYYSIQYLKESNALFAAGDTVAKYKSP